MYVTLHVTFFSVDNEEDLCYTPTEKGLDRIVPISSGHEIENARIRTMFIRILLSHRLRHIIGPVAWDSARRKSLGLGCVSTRGRADT